MVSSLHLGSAWCADICSKAASLSIVGGGVMGSHGGKASKDRRAYFKGVDSFYVLYVLMNVLAP